MNELFKYLYEQVQHNQFFSAGLIGGVVASLGYIGRNAFNFLKYRVIRMLKFSVTIEQNQLLHIYLDWWIEQNYPVKMRRVEAFYTLGKLRLANENDLIFINYKGKRIVIDKTKEKLERSTTKFGDGDDYHARTYSVYSLRGKIAVLNFLDEVIRFGEEAQKKYMESKKNTYLWAYRYEWQRVAELGGKRFDALFFDGKDKLLSDIKQFKDNSSRYPALGIPIKRGYMFYGPPGNGKSSLAYAIAAYFNWDVFPISLADNTEGGFVKVMSTVPNNSVVVFEDIDSFFHGREAVGETKLSFSTFINALSGLQARENIITVMTTNKIELVDSVVLRSGRCDFKLQLHNPTKQYIEDYLSFIYGEKVTLPGPVSGKCFATIQDSVITHMDDLKACVNSIMNE